MKKDSRKYFIIDTNVILHNPRCLKAFKDNVVVLPIDVIEELDHFKTENTEHGRNAREAIRTLDRLREKGSLIKGVQLGSSSGTLMVDPHPIELSDEGLFEDIPDNRILSTASKLQKEGKQVVFVSKDLNARIKAHLIGVEAQDYESEKVKLDELYKGWREAVVSKEDVDRFFSEGSIDLANQSGMCPNEFVLLRRKDTMKHTVMSRCYGSPPTVKPVRHEKIQLMNVTARNLEQRMSVELLLDPDVRLVTLLGKAGTGKTLLALAAGLKCVVKDAMYEKLLVSRPIMPLGRDIGYLPGTKDEKLANWMQPIFDNLKFIFHAKKGGPGESSKRIKDFIQKGLLELEALTYIRGRSIPNQFIIIDEAQNLTPHEVKTIVSRVGHGSKLILTGDPYQIDNPYLDSASNGLSNIVERMKMQKLFGHVMLEKNERSSLASIAAEVL
jgi:PhoH-like ATPase